ncbi:hypothetical protein Rhal01_02303 [Rubritalea halochordaticola]|uniref:Endonuclease/exonuclease/phosphatase domain-containing protein n=1 Tax=Rubritalea halochordaticola TaxID=714537 RepID=A0ABP9V0A3_9BACT
MCRLVLSLIVLVLLPCCQTLPQPEFSPKQDSVKVVTYNVNVSGSGAEEVAKYLRKEDADIVYLQETHDQWEEYLCRHLGKQYTHAYFHSSRGAGGIAFLSKYPLKKLKVIEPERGWFPALAASVDTEIGELQLLNVHLRPPLSDEASVTVSAYYQSPEIHRAELAGFLKHMDGDKPLIVSGDFNENTSKAGVQYLLERGFRDALSGFDTKTETWRWKVSPGIAISNRYDHVIYSKTLHCTGAKVTHLGASDHEPVTAVLIKAE